LRTFLDYNTKMTKTNAITEVVREEKILKVMDLLFSGKNKKDACAEVGIDLWTFDRYVAQSPELIRTIQSAIRTSFSSLIDGITESRRKNVETLLNEAEEIRTSLSAGILDRDKYIASLLKIDAHLGKTMDFIYPVIKEPVDEKPSDKTNDAKAMEILATVKGAKLTMVETKRIVTIEQEDQTEIIEGKTIDS